jgi:ABC-type dipeptide/oligopeptide/nickel transport system permease subunit
MSATTESTQISFYRPVSRSLPRLGVRYLRTHPAEGAALCWVLLLVLLAVVPEVFAPAGFNTQSLRERLQGPSSAHWLGRDELGRDTLSRVIYGTRVSVVVGLLAAGFAAAIGVPLGLAAGYLGGWTDGAIMRVVDAFLAIPGLILALGVVTAMGGGISPLMLAIGVGYVPVFIRLTRGAVLGEIGKQYIQGARATGLRASRIMWRHILPNIMSPLTVQATVAVGLGIIIEASLSFLGVGIRPPQASWGVMLKASYGYLDLQPILSIVPGLAIIITVMSLNFLGDGIRDWFDPRTRYRP